MRQIRLHADSDWCHFCGREYEHQVDVYYSADARVAGSCTPNTHYLRLCRECVSEMQRLLNTVSG
jgi:hypothetical protein